MRTFQEEIERLINISLDEDCPSGDATSDAIVPSDSFSRFKIFAKEKVIACGAFIAASFLTRLSSEFKFDFSALDGKKLDKGDIFLSGKGPSKAILAAERSMLNTVQRLCGIATLANAFVKALHGTGIKILDTRKTTPGLRIFEKYAVRTGGGKNHRFSLSDMILLKENHLMIEARLGKGYIRRAVQKCRKSHPDLKIEVEIRFLKEAKEASISGADIIMLDNMTSGEILKCVKIIDKRAKIEISGNITLDNIKKYILPGIDYISVGALTHSFKSSDLSLLIENE